MTTRQKGFTVVELMVGLLLSSLLIGGVVQIYLSAKSTANFTRGLARIQDSASFSLELMTRDIRMAGFIPCGYPEIFNNEVDGSAGEWWTSLHTQPLRGYEGGSPGLPSFITNLDATRVESSDVLVVMRSGTNITAVDSYDSGSERFITQRNLSDAWQEDNGRLMVACDQGEAVLFQSEAINAGTTNIDVLNGSIPAFSDGAQLADYSAAIYYVRQSPSGNDFSLYREFLNIDSSNDVQTPSEELVEGVESMQLLYGLDQNNDGVAEQYLQADAIADNDWLNVVTVRIGLLLASQDGVRSLAGFDERIYRVAGTEIGPVASGVAITYSQDSRRRLVSTTTVGVRNVN